VRAWQRWAAVCLGLVALVAIPSVVAARPVHDSHVSADALLSRVRASTSIGYSGLVETHGSLFLPNIPNAGDLAALLSQTTRLRVWWGNAEHFRVDQLATDGEHDTAVDGPLTQLWDSTRNRLIRSFGVTALRTPRATDLLPPDLAQRLVPRNLPATATRQPAVRIAGRTGLGLRLTPTNNDTTVRYVDIDVDSATGLPLRVAIVPRGSTTPAVSTDFLEIKIADPARRDIRFVAPPGALISHQPIPDFVADADQFAPFALPDTLAGLRRSQRVSTLTRDSGAATYGLGYTLLALVPVRPDTADQVFKALRPPNGVSVDLAHPGAEAVAEHLALANVLVVFVDQRAYALSGTVRLSTLTRAAEQLADAPPPFRHDRGPQ
jgi:hypothetical protein